MAVIERKGVWEDEAWSSHDVVELEVTWEGQLDVVTSPVGVLGGWSLSRVDGVAIWGLS